MCVTTRNSESDPIRTGSGLKNLIWASRNAEFENFMQILGPLKMSQKMHAKKVISR
jgi:hypothetical protein